MRSNHRNGRGVDESQTLALAPSGLLRMQRQVRREEISLPAIIGKVRIAKPRNHIRGGAVIEVCSYIGGSNEVEVCVWSTRESAIAGLNPIAHLPGSQPRQH